MGFSKCTVLIGWTELDTIYSMPRPDTYFLMASYDVASNIWQALRAGSEKAAPAAEALLRAAKAPLAKVGQCRLTLSNPY